jgi:hypothetical protein
MRWVLLLAAVGEAGTGIALVVVPSLVGRVLVGEELAGVAGSVARVAGIALIGLAVACWPRKTVVGLLIFGVGVALYLALLLDKEIAGVAVPVARVAGIALIGLAIACWPGKALMGMLTYSAGVTLYLAYVGIAGVHSGVLLWPAVALHAVLTVLLARAAISDNLVKA